MVDELRREQKQNMELRKLRDKIEGIIYLLDIYSKTCLEQPLKKKTKIGFQD